MKILVPGATGFMGNLLIQKLLTSVPAVKIRVLVRDEAKIPESWKDRVEIHLGILMHFPSLFKAGVKSIQFGMKK